MYLTVCYRIIICGCLTGYLSHSSAHHWVYETSGVLHRDLTVDNVMFHYTDADTVVGILTDWDLSSTEKSTRCLRDPGEEEDVVAEIEGADEPQDTETTSKTEARPRYRTGRGPFLALDLLCHKPIAHQYRHDLEAFFYVLCYFCSQFRSGDAENPKPYFAYLPEWEKGDVKQLYSTKQELLLQPDSFKALFNDINPTFQPLVNRWIIPLYEQIFVELPEYTLRMLGSIAKLQLARDRDDKIKCSKHMKELQSLTRDVNETVNYEAFKKILLT